jgi:hypothetical protein
MGGGGGATHLDYSIHTNFAFGPNGKVITTTQSINKESSHIVVALVYLHYSHVRI